MVVMFSPAAVAESQSSLRAPKRFVSHETASAPIVIPRQITVTTRAIVTRFIYEGNLRFSQDSPKRVRNRLLHLLQSHGRRNSRALARFAQPKDVGVKPQLRRVK